MYTEFHFNSELKKNTPEKVINILKFMVDGGDEPDKLPDHRLFQTGRWQYMLRCDSYYFDADTISTLRLDTVSKSYYLCIRTNLKNYDSEIEEFIDWITPYLEKSDGDFLGFYRYEEDQDPTIIKYKEK